MNSHQKDFNKVIEVTIGKQPAEGNLIVCGQLDVITLRKCKYGGGLNRPLQVNMEFDLGDSAYIAFDRHGVSCSHRMLCIIKYWYDEYKLLLEHQHVLGESDLNQEYFYVQSHTHPRRRCRHGHTRHPALREWEDN